LALPHSFSFSTLLQSPIQRTACCPLTRSMHRRDEQQPNYSRYSADARSAQIWMRFGGGRCLQVHSIDPGRRFLTKAAGGPQPPQLPKPEAVIGASPPLNYMAAQLCAMTLDHIQHTRSPQWYAGRRSIWNGNAPSGGLSSELLHRA